jgi:hypothetical protein
MKYLKSFSEINETNSVIDAVNKKAFQRKMDTVGYLTLDDIVGNFDIYCGIHKNSGNKEICGYYYGESNLIGPDKEENWSKKVYGTKCPNCKGIVGNIVQWVSNEDLNNYEEEDLPGEGFYFLSQEDEKEIKSDNKNSNVEKDSEEKPSVKKVLPKDVYSFLEENLRPITLCYTNILPEKFKGVGPGKMNERSIQDALLKLQRECKYGDVMRAKEAVGTWVRFIYTMKSSREGLNNWNNWLKTSNGKKYGLIVQEFEKKIYWLAPEKYPKGYNF